MKKLIALLLALVLCLSLCACGDESTSKKEAINDEEKSTNDPASDVASEEQSGNTWSVQFTTDEFGDVTVSSSAVMFIPISGDFSNTATSSSELTGYVYMIMGEEYPVFMFRLLEYGSTQATFTSYDVITQKIKIGDKIYENEGVFGNPPNSDLTTYDTQQVLYSALYAGTDVRSIIYIGSSQYNFTISSENFATVCEENGWVTQLAYFNMTDHDVLYEEAKTLIAEGKYDEANAYLDYLKEYMDVADIQKENACNISYYGTKDTDARNAWKQFFDLNTAVPLTDEEIKEIIVGEWRSGDSAYAVYTENGEYHYFYGETEQNPDIPNTWRVEGGFLYRESEYTSSKFTIYHFYKNAYIFCFHQSSSNVYELKFLNGPLE